MFLRTGGREGARKLLRRRLVRPARLRSIARPHRAGEERREIVRNRAGAADAAALRIAGGVGDLWTPQAGEYPIKEVAMAKLYTSEVAFHIADECVQAHGGMGYMMESPAQRALRDTRLGPIGGGTSEIMREIIGRTMGL